MHVLIIEDEKKTASFISRGLKQEDHTVDVAENGKDGLDQASKGTYDLILLDVMLPAMDGWEVLKRLREMGNDTPVFLLTVLGSVEDRAKGMGLGANGYITKPFAFSELLARIDAGICRGESPVAEVLTVGDLELDLSSRRAKRGGMQIKLSVKEFSLLALLARHSGQPLSRSRIAQTIWNVDFDSQPAVVDVHMQRLRSKIDNTYGTSLIHTVPGIGYVLEKR